MTRVVALFLKIMNRPDAELGTKLKLEAKALMITVDKYSGGKIAYDDYLAAAEGHLSLMGALISEAEGREPRLPADGTGKLLRFILYSVNQGLIETIRLHGPITTENVSSASKRIRRFLLQRSRAFRSRA